MSHQINLYSPIFLKQQKHFSLRTMLESLLLITLGIVGVYGYAWFQVQGLALRAEESEKRVQFEQLRLSRLAKELAPRERSRELEEQVRRFEADLAERRQVVELLKGGALGAPRGYSEYLRALARSSMPGLWLIGFSVSPGSGDLALRGRALSPELVPAYLGRLKAEAVLQGGRFDTLEIGLPRAEPARAAPGFVEFRLQAAKAEGAR